MAIPAASYRQVSGAVQHVRPFDKTGVTVFEAPVDSAVPFNVSR